MSDPSKAAANGRRRQWRGAALDRARPWAHHRRAVSRSTGRRLEVVSGRGGAVRGAGAEHRLRRRGRNIGYQAPGRVPVRGKGDGRYPAPGWIRRMTGSRSSRSRSCRREFNPDGLHRHRQPGGDQQRYPHFLTRDWTLGYRPSGSTDQLAGAHGKLDFDALARLQFDKPQQWCRGCGAEAARVRDDGQPRRGSAAAARLDLQQPEDSAPAAFYNATGGPLLARTFDELPRSTRRAAASAGSS